MRQSTRAGLTLIETLVAAVVSILCMTALFQLFVTGARLYARGQARTDLQAAGMIAVSALSREMRRSNFQSLTIVTPADSTQPGPIVSFRSDDGFAVYYFDPDRQSLVRRTFVAAATRLTAADLNGVVLNPALPERLVSSGISAMTITPTRYPAQVRDPSVDIQLTLRKTDVLKQGGSTETVEEIATTSVSLRTNP